MSAKQKRIDQVLVARALCKSRAHAQKKIAAGCVFLQKAEQMVVVLKASELIDEDTVLIVHEDELDRYVSRGGLKLEGACTRLKLSIDGMQCLDVGASTGGFTDFLLQNNATSVVCMDVGIGQMDPKIATDTRVTHIEKINCRYPDQLHQHLENAQFDLIVMDVSFITITLILPHLKKYLKPSGFLLSLVKPQFELWSEALNHAGIVKDKGLYVHVEKKIKENLHNSGYEVIDYFQSTELGGDGNVEFFVFAK